MRLSEREKSLLCVAALAGMTLFAFSPCIFNGFLSLDDPILVLNNPLIRDLSPSGVAEIFFRPTTDLYVPLVVLSYAAEFRFFGLDPMAYHATNVLVHALNAALVFVFLRGFFRSWAPAFAGALVFAVHPLNVEAVAWISQRKDVLFFFFAMLSLVLHARGRRAWAVAALGMALFSKPMAVTLPALFALTDVCLAGKRPRDALRDAAPAFALAAAFAASTLAFFSLGGHIRPVSAAEWWNVPFYALASYALKAFAPAGLAPFYPWPQKGDALLAAAPFLCASLAAAIFFFRKRPRLVFGPVFFAVALVPALQFVPVGHTPVADRYAYLPLAGLAFLFASAVERASSTREGRALAAALTAAVFAPFFALTFERCKAWADDARLFGDNIAKYPETRMPYHCRANHHYVTGDLPRALADVDRAIAIAPGHAFDVHMRARILGTMKRYEESLEDFREAIEICPTCAGFYGDRGVTLGNLGRYEEAAADFRKALALEPDHEKARSDLEKTEEIIKLLRN